MLVQTENLARARAVGRTVFFTETRAQTARRFFAPTIIGVAGDDAAMGAPLDHSGFSVASADS